MRSPQMPLRALSYRLHRLARQFHEDFDPDAQHYPSTEAALDTLDAALQDEMPQAPAGSKTLTWGSTCCARGDLA